MPIVIQNSDRFTNLLPKELFVKSAIQTTDEHHSGISFKSKNQLFLFQFIKACGMCLKDKSTFRNMLFFISDFSLKSFNTPLIFELKDIRFHPEAAPSE